MQLTVAEKEKELVVVVEIEGERGESDSDCVSLVIISNIFFSEVGNRMGGVGGSANDFQKCATYLGFP